MDYITLTVNERVVEQFIQLWLYFCVLLGVFILIKCTIDIIESEKKEREERELKKKAEPFMKVYKDLLLKQKYREAIAYKENHKIISEVESIGRYY